MKTKYTVRLASVGNPDYRQDPKRPMYGAARNKTVAVDSMEEASRASLEFINNNNLGSGNWAGGDVTDSVGAIVAHVSYNGRVWEGKRGSWTSATREISRTYAGIAKAMTAQ